MKIAIIVCRFKPYKGGISNMAYDQALGLADLGHEVTVFTYLNSPEDEEFQAKEYKIVRLKPWFKFGNAAFLPQLFKYLSQFDIVHLHYPFFGAAEVVWLWKIFKGRKKKLVITYHMDVVGSGWLAVFFKIHRLLLLKSIIKQAQKIIVTSIDYGRSSDIRQHLAKWPEKYIAIPPSVDLRRFTPAPKDPELLQKYGLNPDQDKILGFVGVLDQAHYFKGLDFLIDSFPALLESIPNLKLIAIGGGNLLNKYQEKVKANGLQDKIFFAGLVSDADLSRYYNLADVVTLPSIDRSEAFGLTLTEAMACAKPVIAANLPGVRSVFTDKVEGCNFSVKDRMALARCLQHLFNNDILRLNMGQSARIRAEKDYSQVNLIKKLEGVYWSIINQ